MLKEASSAETPKPTAHPSRAPHGVHAESKAKPRGSFHFSPNLLSAKGSYKHPHGGKLQQCAEVAPETEQASLLKLTKRQMLKKKRRAEKAPFPGIDALYMTAMLEEVRTPAADNSPSIGFHSSPQMGFQIF